MRTILVTGGAGFIGSNLVYYLANKYPEDRVIVLDALTYAGSTENLPSSMYLGENPRLHFWYGNVCNSAIVEALVQEADIVIHLAAETHVTRSIYDSLLFFQTDVIGTQTVANAVLKARGKVKRLIHVSSSEVYGTARAELMSETHPLEPMSPYASAKCGADRLVFSYWATYRIPAVIVRPFNNYGPRQHLEKVVPRFVTGMLLNEPLNVHGGGQSARDFIHVDDTCRGIDAVMSASAELVEGEVFNLASGQHRTIRSIANDIVELMNGNKDSIQSIGERPGQVVRHSGDWSKIKNILKWEPQIAWQDGLKRTVQWYTDNKPSWSKQLFMRRIPIITASGKMEYH
jgi:dTDP-glucose 4,6-dehydratase